MQNNNNPGHTIGGGYPFEKNESKALFDHLKHVNLRYDHNYTIEENESNFTGFIQELQKALEIAENQIDDMLHEDPFMPETFGFEVAHRNMGIHEPPVRIYLSKYNERYTLFRKPGTPGDKDWNPMAWILKEKMPDGSFKDIELNLCSHRIAYAAFYALGVQVKDKTFVEKVADEVREQMAEHNKKIEEYLFRPHEESKEMGGVSPLIQEAKEASNLSYTHKVFFRRKDGVYNGENGTLNDLIKTVEVNAGDKTEALTKAKFILETDADHPIEDVKFEELSIIK